MDASDSPTNLLRISEGLIGRNAASASPASALASSVFPHPGGPCMKTEVGLARIPYQTAKMKNR